MKGVSLHALAGLLTVCAAGASFAAQDPAPTPQTALPLVSKVSIQGATVYTPDELERRYGLAPGKRLDRPVGELAERIRKRYRREGYAFTEVTTEIDAAGVLTIQIDEGQIDDIEFRGLEPDVADRLRGELGLQPGEIFNQSQASRALERALEITHGAIERRGRTFEMIRENGRRVLQINLRSRHQRSGVFVGSNGREDWYSPVDGFNPALGFQSTIFDPRRFNHAYYVGYVSYKFGPERVGYTFGLERPFFADGVLQVGGSIHDVTASDDRWRLSDGEQSLVAFGFRNTFRDYYRRKGYQLHAAVRPFSAHEWFVGWRDESHVALTNTTDYGLFRDEHAFRPNALAAEGDLRALLLGYTFDTRGLIHESPGERYRRHQADSLFGSSSEREHGVRVEWRSEIAPASFEHGFDFSRHILNARTWIEMSPGRLLSARVLGGTSEGTLPTQRVFALGGIGSVHGYSFKEAAGEKMLLLNGEIRQRFGHSGNAAVAFIDAGRVYRPLPGSREEWLKGVGVGLELGSSRIELGFRLNDIPSSLQVLFRLGPTF